MTITTIDGALRSVLTGNAGVQNLVNFRIYPQELPLNCSFPAISTFKVSNPWSRVQASPRFQVSCFAEDFLQCQQLAAAVEAALCGYNGIIDGFQIIGIIPDGSTDLFDSEAGEAGIYHIPYSFIVSYIKIS